MRVERQSSLSNSGRRSRWGTFRTSLFGKGFSTFGLNIYIYIYIFWSFHPFSAMIFVNLHDLSLGHFCR